MEDFRKAGADNGLTTSKVAALTGRPGVGKTTALIKILHMLQADGHVVGGFYTREVRSGGVRRGFEVYDIMSGKKGMLASTELAEGAVGRQISCKHPGV
jgi:nucleoside-triphosphatase THEP1